MLQPKLNNQLLLLLELKPAEEAEEVVSEEAEPEVAEVDPEVVVQEAPDKMTRIGFPLPSSEDSSNTT